MKEPQRLLRDASTPGIARSMLLAGRARREPEGAQERVWSAVAVGLAGGAAASAGAAATTTKAAGVATSFTALKLVTIGIALAVAVTGVIVVAGMEHAPPAVPPSPTTITATPTATEAPTAEPAVVAVAEPEPVASSSSSSPRVAPRPPSKTNASSLREEAALLQDARAALGRGDVEGARAAIDIARARFKGGQLSEEREALEIRVASAGGERARAATLAKAFVERHPDSTMRAGIEPFLEKKE